MQTKTLLVLSFVIISLVPASLLSAISFISLSKLEQSISNIYLGTVTIISNLSDGQKELVDMRLNMDQFIATSNEQERQGILQQINQNEGNFLKTLIEYKEIDDFPMQTDILQHRGMGNLTSYEHSLLAQVNNDWRDYQQAKNRIITLSNEGLRENATIYSNTIAADKFSRLATTYSKVVDLNNNLAFIMYDESQSVAKQAYLFGVIASGSSIAFGVAAALLISKRLAPSVDELQQEARKKIEKFISKGSSTKMPLQVTATTANSEVQKMGAETIPSTTTAVGSLDNNDNNGNNNDTSSTDLMLQQQVAELLEKGPMILLHFSQYKELKEENRQQPSEGQKSKTTVADSLLDHYLATTTTGQQPSSTSSSTTTGGKKTTATNLVLITKRTSNLYSLGRRSGAAIYILSSSSQDPITTSEDGLLIISISQTSLILEAIKRTLRENPNSVIILDNITELIHKLGFAKVFSLVQSVSDEVSPYPKSRIIILINENAHPQNEVEAIATICNAFIR